MAESRLGTSGKTDCEAELELDRTYCTLRKNTTGQHNAASSNVEPTWQKERGAAKEQLEERHGDRNEETWNDVDKHK